MTHDNQPDPMPVRPMFRFYGRAATPKPVPGGVWDGQATPHFATGSCYHELDGDRRVWKWNGRKWEPARPRVRRAYAEYIAQIDGPIAEADLA